MLRVKALSRGLEQRMTLLLNAQQPAVLNAAAGLGWLGLLVRSEGAAGPTRQ
jgi:hypothetical protein